MDGDRRRSTAAASPAPSVAEPLPPRDVALEYLAEGVRAPQVTLVRGALKLIRSLGEPDLLYDLDRDPDERQPRRRPRARGGPGGSGRAAADARWDLRRLDRAVRAQPGAAAVSSRRSRDRRRYAWDHPAPDDGATRYIGTGCDFWSTLERARRV